jgi:cellobiose phosphorylase
MSPRTRLHGHRVTPRAGIDVETLYFVPLGETLEIWRSRVTDLRDTTAQLSVFSAIEFSLWDAWDDATNLQRNLSIGEVEMDGGVIYHTTEYRERRNHFAYLACSADLAGFDTDRERFLGPYRGWDRPAVVEQGRSADSITHGWAPCGFHHVELTLDPGQTREIVFLLGYAENTVDAKFDPPGSQRIDKHTAGDVIRRYLRSGEVDAAFRRLAESWSGLLGTLQISTPSEHADRPAHQEIDGTEPSDRGSKSVGGRPGDQAPA